jgi:hypothetical protein
MAALATVDGLKDVDPLTAMLEEQAEAALKAAQIAKKERSDSFAIFERAKGSVDHSSPSPTKRGQKSLKSKSAKYSTSIPTTSTHTEGSKMYTVYNICVRIQGFKHMVAKRFSEFQFLKESLKKHFPNIRLPSFPSKGGIGGFLTRLNDSTIESRRQNLETFLSAALNHGKIKRFSQMVFFLEIEDAVRGANEELQLASAERRLMEDEQSRERQGEGVGGQRISGHNSSFAERLSRGGRAPPKPVLFTPMAKAPTAARYPPTGEGLREAIKHGSLGGVRTVVDEAAANGVENVGCYIDYSGQPMLHLACIFNNVEIVMFLIERGADPDTKNARDETAYDIATDTLAAKMKVLVDRLDAGGP